MALNGLAMYSNGERFESIIDLLANNPCRFVGGLLVILHSAIALPALPGTYTGLLDSNVGDMNK
jgi:hypothetical protein